jgi:hypothetical protein
MSETNSAVLSPLSESVWNGYGLMREGRGDWIDLY